MPSSEMDFQQQQFRERLERIARERGRLSEGMVFRVGSDGLIRPVPKPRRSHVVLSTLFPVLGVMVLLKAMLVASIDEATYSARLSGLAAGDVVERAGALVMQNDPATDWLAGRIAVLLP